MNNSENPEVKGDETESLQMPSEIAETNIEGEKKEHGKTLTRIWHTAIYAGTVLIGLSLLLVVVYSFLPPPVTPLMIIRSCQKAGEKGHRIDKEWIPCEKVSPYLINAVVASEDSLLLSHFGIDRKAIGEAIEHNKNSRRVRGASTITQQGAKNVFLWPSRTYFRKGFELYFTFLIEIVWSKKRIMEVYLNVIETGDGVYGAEAAARKYFHKPASELTRGEAALIAVSLPNPRQRNPANPSGYMTDRQGAILDLMSKIGDIKFK